MQEYTVTDAYVEQRLNEWGEWFSRRDYIDIGFPRRTILARLKDEGGQLIHCTGPKPLPTHSRAEEMEKIIIELKKDRPTPGYILMVTYLFPDAPMVVSKRLFQCEKTTYHRQLSIAFAWVKGYLIAKFNLKKAIEKRS